MNEFVLANRKQTKILGTDFLKKRQQRFLVFSHVVVVFNVLVVLNVLGEFSNFLKCCFKIN